MACSPGTGWGTILKRNGSVVADVKSIKGPKVEYDTIDATPLYGLAPVKVMQPGLADPGELECELYFNKTQIAILYENACVTATWQVVTPDNSSWTASGFIKTFDNTFEADKKIMSNMTIKLQSMPVFVAG